ncbi:uncharacterized protein LOC113371992 [Ctenocephalides felis]|uniref:uncharacterized protein LOC113371992 n=1 Tax=Ctenocephalides felis TaxID=7515 RepID=UPI000E6E47DC|nr:uncharacterized protein LOC113371992 [Ctenocephalides felis]
MVKIFCETYSPVARSTSIRLLAALSAEIGLEIHQMDVVTAYLNGELEEKVYMNLPEQLHELLYKIVNKKPLGTIQKPATEKIRDTAKTWLKNIEKSPDPVCLLKKALYGLRQSGALMYLAVTTRPDIAYAVNYLSQFNTNYDTHTLERSKESAPISWEARKQKIVAQSTTEAEYIALSEATREAIYLNELLKTLDIGSETVTYIMTARVLYNFEQMPADMLTKGLTRNKHEECLRRIGMDGLQIV